MAIVNFGFTKINVEKDDSVKGSVKISNNVSIKDAKKIDLPIKSAKREVVEFTFLFVSKYDPKLGEISVEGKLAYMDDKEKVAEIIKQWKKEKKVPKETMMGIMNVILDKCNIQAILLSQQVGLPCPVPLPKAKSA